MYKRIKAGHNLRITGEGLYLGADTFVYFNSVATENKAEIVPSSFNSLGTELQIRIPEALPNKLNTIIIKNEIGVICKDNPIDFADAVIQLHTEKKLIRR